MCAVWNIPGGDVYINVAGSILKIFKQISFTIRENEPVMNAAYSKSTDIQEVLQKVFFEDQEVGSQFRVRLCDFGGVGSSTLRAGVSRFWWSSATNKWLPTAKSHCYFPIEALSELSKALEHITEVANAIKGPVVEHGMMMKMSRFGLHTVISISTLTCRCRHLRRSRRVCA